jgi:hypothetical protein
MIERTWVRWDEFPCLEGSLYVEKVPDFLEPLRSTPHCDCCTMRFGEGILDFMPGVCLGVRWDDASIGESLNVSVKL